MIICCEIISFFHSSSLSTELFIQNLILSFLRQFPCSLVLLINPPRRFSLLIPHFSIHFCLFTSLLIRKDCFIPPEVTCSIMGYVYQSYTCFISLKVSRSITKYVCQSYTYFILPEVTCSPTGYVCQSYTYLIPPEV